MNKYVFCVKNKQCKFPQNYLSHLKSLRLYGKKIPTSSLRG